MPVGNFPSEWIFVQLDLEEVVLVTEDAVLDEDSQTAESGAKNAKYAVQLIEAQVATGSVEDIVGREIRPELGVVLSGDRLVADADQLAGQGLSEMKPGILPLVAQEWMVIAYPSGSANTKVRPNGPSKGSVTIRTPA